MKGAAEIIKNSRLQLGFTQEDLAKKLDITTTYLSLIENAKRDPSSKLQRKISKHLRIPFYFLILTNMQDTATNKAEKEMSKMIKELYERIQKKI